jgi:hypothetical protein
MDVAVDTFDNETKRTNGKPDLWCNGNPLKRSYIRQFLRFELGDGAVVVIGQIGLGWGRVDYLYPFELDAGQVEALIAKLKRKQKREPKLPGRHQHAMRGDILPEYDRRRACTPPERHELADLQEWADKKLKKLEKYATTIVPHTDTIGRWLRERDQPPT